MPSKCCAVLQMSSRWCHAAAAHKQVVMSMLSSGRYIDVRLVRTCKRLAVPLGSSLMACIQSLQGLVSPSDGVPHSPVMFSGRCLHHMQSFQDVLSEVWQTFPKLSLLEQMLNSNKSGCLPHKCRVGPDRAQL